MVELMSLSKTISKNFFYLPATYLHGMNIPKALDELNSSQYYPLHHLELDQLKRLNELLRYASARVPYYFGKVWAINSLEEITQFPVITKWDIQSHFVDMISMLPFKHVISKRTGGSTGSPLLLKHTAITHAYHLAAMWRGYGWASVEMGDSRAHFWATPQSAKGRIMAKVQDFIANRRRFSASAFSAKDLDAYIKRLDSFEPTYLYGYSSMMEVLANYMLDSGRRLNFTPNAIITTGELLTPERRAIIQQGFYSRVFDEYGCGEVGTIAHECEHGNLHINSENLIVEILDDNNEPVPEGTVGNVVVTLLRNHVMPIIRYKIGDLASLSTEHNCPCGRHLPVLTPPKGRVMDYFKARDGRTVYGNHFIHNLLATFQEPNKIIKQIQVVQENYNLFYFNIIPGKDYSQYVEDLLVGIARSNFGNNVSVEVNVVDNIPRAASGKLRTVICKV